MPSFGINPENRMGDVVGIMGIQGNVNRVEAIDVAVQNRRQALESSNAPERSAPRGSQKSF